MIKYIFKRSSSVDSDLSRDHFFVFCHDCVWQAAMLSRICMRMQVRQFSQEVIDETRKEYGLDQPFLVQYAKWFAGMATGDMGKSYVSRRDVYESFHRETSGDDHAHNIFCTAYNADRNSTRHSFSGTA